MLYIAALKACSLINRLEFTLLMVSAIVHGAATNTQLNILVGLSTKKHGLLILHGIQFAGSTFTDVLLKLISLQLTGEIWLQIM